jgi:hypothetical protein
MLKYDDTSALAQIRSYFDELGYSYVSQRLSDQGIPLTFAEFSTLQNACKEVNPVYSLLISLFRQGHAADEEILKQALPGGTFEAMAETGLLVQNSRGQWKTPGLVIIPVEGLYLAVSTPPNYPTTVHPKQPIYIGQDSLWLVSALPSRLTGLRVLDICSGSGVQGMVCAVRGAAKVVGLEKSDLAFNVSNFNVALNRLADVVEIRQSDLFSALSDDDSFDFFVTNPPFMPVMEDINFPLPGAGGADGMTLLREIFAGLPSHLTETAEGYMIVVGLGDQYSINMNQELLLPFAEKQGFEVRSFVHDKLPIQSYLDNGLESMIRYSCPEISRDERRAKIAAWYGDLQRRGVPASYTYTQIIKVRRVNVPAGMINLPIYHPLLTDPLIARTSLSRAKS